MNNGIIKMNGKSYIKSKIRPIPTSDVTKLQRCGLDWWDFGRDKLIDDRWSWQYLVFTSNQYIQAGDHVLLPNNIIKLMSDSDMIDYLDSGSDATKKIIAGTDKSLTYNNCTYCNRSGYLVLEHTNAVDYEECPICKNKKFPFPRPSKKFLYNYCDMGGVDEVLVEFIELGGTVFSPEEPYELRVGPDNIILTKPLKSNWTREEVIDLLHRRMRYSFGLDYQESTTDKWIEENL